MTILIPSLWMSAAALLQGGSTSHVSNWETAGTLQGEYRGTDAAPAGDVNGDGHEDLIVLSFGTPAVPGVHGRGRADLYLGTATGIPTTPSWSVFGGTGQIDPLDW